jgi:hypothetical protein
MNLGALNRLALDGGGTRLLTYATASLTGVGGVGANATRRDGGGATTIGQGWFTATGVRIAGGATGAIGRGFLGATASHQQAATADFPGAGAFGAYLLRVVNASASLYGVGSAVFIPASRLGVSVPIGRGILAGNATRVQAAASAFALGSASVTGIALVYRLPTAAPTGQGTLRGEPRINNTHFSYAAPVGRGAMAIDQTKVYSSADSIYAVGTGALDAVLTLRQAARADFPGGIVLDALATVYMDGAAGMAGSGALAGSGLRTVYGTWAPVARGTLVGALRQRYAATASLAGSMSMSATLTYVFEATSSFGTLSLMTGEALVERRAFSVPTGRGTLAATALLNLFAAETGGELYYREAKVREFSRAFRLRTWENGMGLLDTVEKQSGEIEDYTIDYSKDLSKTDDITAIVSCTADSPDLTITSAIVPGARQVTFFVAGGTNKAKYKVTTVVDTSEGRRLEDELIIKIKDV